MLSPANEAATDAASEKLAPYTFIVGESFGERPTRSTILEEKMSIRSVRKGASEELRMLKGVDPEKPELWRVVQECLAKEKMLEDRLRDDFVPQHSPNQLISPRAFFVSPLFRVCAKGVPRAPEVSLTISSGSNADVRYIGPELRQSDGLVFMALLHLARDAEAGTPVTFLASDLCRALFHRYDGPARTALKQHIQRLQRAVVEIGPVSVQLCQRAEFSSRGPWLVALDRDVVRLFERSPNVWLDMKRRLALPEGLATWLYGYIESQTRLIPLAVSTLRALCGSNASAESFPKVLRRSLNDLARVRVIDPGWFVKGGQVHWRKGVQSVS